MDLWLEFMWVWYSPCYQGINTRTLRTYGPHKHVFKVILYCDKQTKCIPFSVLAAWVHRLRDQQCA